MHKLFIATLSAMFAAGSIPALAQEPEPVVEDQTVVSSADTLHFVLDVRWGNVEGEVTDRTETNFDGSVSVPQGSHVSFRRTLLFEDHDSMTGRLDPVSWTSKIYGHWDGVRVLVSAKASDAVTITTTQGTLTKTAQEFFQAGAPIVQDVGSGREIIARARPLEKRGFFLAMGWGHTSREISELETFPILNFSGSATLAGGGVMRLVRPLRFELNDAVTSTSNTTISWRSVIRGGVDGLLVRVHPDRMLDASDTLTVHFTELGFSQSFAVSDLFHEKITRVSVPITGYTGYELVFRVVRHPYHRLMRARNDYRVWLVEDDMRRHVISADAFNREGLRWEEVEEAPEAVVDMYPEGDAFGYKDGMLIKGSSPTVYVLSDGKRRPITSPAAFTRLGWRWENIIQIPDSDVAQYPEGAVMNETGDAPEDSLIRVEGLPTVYQIKGGKRLPIPSLAVFSGNKFGWEQVMEVKQEIRDKFPQGEAVGYPDGSLLSSEDGKVHVVSNGERHWVRTALDFSGRGYDWSAIRRVSNAELNSYSEGRELELSDL